MIGVNVAVRAGAQGIGFAIPIDSALRVAARLLNVQRLQGKWHGLVAAADDDPSGPLRVAKVRTDSPAASAGLQAGDEIVRVGSLASHAAARPGTSAARSARPANRCPSKFAATARSSCSTWRWPSTRAVATPARRA